MDNLRQIGQSYLFSVYIKEFKSLMVSFKQYYPEQLALTSDILNTHIETAIIELDKQLGDVDNINFKQISQIYSKFIQNVNSSLYLTRLSECLKEFKSSQSHPINQLDIESFSPELKAKIVDFISKYDQDLFHDETLFISTNISIESTNDIINGVFTVFQQANIVNVPKSLNLSLKQFETMHKLKTIIQKIFRLKPFFDIRNNYGLIDSKITNLSNTDLDANEADSNKIIRLESQVETLSTVYHNHMTEIANLTAAIEKLKADNEEYRVRMSEIQALKNIKIRISEENALLRKDNERLRELCLNLDHSEPSKSVLNRGLFDQELVISSVFENSVDSSSNMLNEDVDAKDIEDKLKLQYEQMMNDELKKRDVELGKLIQLIQRMHISFEKMKSCNEL